MKTKTKLTLTIAIFLVIGALIICCNRSSLHEPEPSFQLNGTGTVEIIRLSPYPKYRKTLIDSVETGLIDVGFASGQNPHGAVFHSVKDRLIWSDGIGESVEITVGDSWDWGPILITTNVGSVASGATVDFPVGDSELLDNYCLKLMIRKNFGVRRYELEQQIRADAPWEFVGYCYEIIQWGTAGYFVVIGPVKIA